jgi:hypothetical protein
MTGNKRVIPDVRSTVVLIGTIAALAASAMAATPSLSLSGASGAPGSTVTLDVSLNSVGSPQPAAIQWDLTYSTSDLSLVTGTYYGTGAAGSGAGKAADCNSISAGDVRCIVSGIDTTAFGSGVVATLTFQIAAATTDTSTPVSLVSPAASDGNANALAITATGATVTITQPVAPFLSSLNCSPASVTPPTTSTCTVSLSGAVPSTTAIGLSSSAAAATVQSSVNITAGLTSTTFTVSTSTVSSSTPAVITATLGSGSKNFTVTLTPAATCSYTLSANSLNFGFSAGSGSFNVLTSAGCSWTVVNNSTFITVTAGSSGSGNGTVSYSAPMNMGAARSGTLTIASQTFTLNQAAGAISPVSVSPSVGSGLTQTFTFTLDDPNGYADLAVVNVLINDSLDGIQGCYVAFAPTSATSGYLYLVDDAGDGGYASGSPISLPSNGTMQNGQCTISGTGSAVSANGKTLTLRLAITFSSSFAGNRVFYVAARNNSTGNSGWQALGTWNVSGPAPTGPAVGGVSPARSATTGQTFTFTFTDTNGYADLAVVNVLTNNSLDGIGACYLAFAPTGATSGQLYLVDDAGDGGYIAGSPISVPSNSTLQNSQCTISAGGSSVSASGNTLTLNLAITFSSSFAGNQVFYLAARNNSTGNSGWQAVGSVNVP